MSSVKVAVIYHSGFGHTKVLAEAVLKGARSVEGVSADIFTSEEASENLDKLTREYSAMIFGSPTYMGNVSAKFKDFQDQTSPLFVKRAWKDKLAAGFTVAASKSGSKGGTLIAMTIFAAQHGMHWINLGLLSGNNSTDGSDDNLNRTGQFLGVGAQANADEGSEVAPHKSDLLTGEYLGQRVARVAHKLF